LYLICVFCVSINAFTQTARTIWLDDLAIKTFSEGIPSVSPKTNAGGDSIRMKGNYFNRGIGVNSTSVLSFYINENALEFSATVGVDDLGNKSLSHHFYVVADRKVVFESGAMKCGDEPKYIQVSLNGVKRLGLLVAVQDQGYQRVYTNWANAKLVMVGGNLPLNIPNTDEKYILTPEAPRSPMITAPLIFGATPGNPFLFTVTATGRRPIVFSAINLPDGLSIDANTGIIIGKINQRGTYLTTLKAKNNFGEATKILRIKIGDTIALTPPMGWNGWNSWARNIDRAKVIASADAMVRKGLSQHGWTYINIDDAWQGQRGGAFNAIQPNEKFPKFREMVDYIHRLGLKVGLYSTPMITSYAGYVGGSSNFEKGELPDSIINNKRAYRYVGKYQFETNDALQMAAWGIDYLKYDWRIEVPSAERMSLALKKSGRDIFYSISNSAPFAHVKDWVRLANSWRTGPDIRDSWLSLYVSAFTLDKWSPYGGPGHWNDPDMMILGNVTTGTGMHPTRLTPDEQYSHVSLFCLLSAPLLIGCPIEQLDEFTLNLLTNIEVIAINQDPLGTPARLVLEDKDLQVWLKPLEDGSYAIGMFNMNGYRATPESYFRWGDEKEKQYTLDFNRLGLNGKWSARDVWRQKDLGDFTGSFHTKIRHHGVTMIRVYAKSGN